MNAAAFAATEAVRWAFSPLELALLAVLGSLVVGLAVFFLTRSVFVSCASCKERHEALGDRLEKGERKFARIEEQVAALIIYNERIPETVKAELVAPGGKD